MTVAALIVAAGRGTRAGPGAPKQYRSLCGQPVLRRSFRALRACPAIGPIRVVIHPDDRAAHDAALAGLDPGAPVEGGATRRESVARGLEALSEASPELVLIHDAARPFASRELVGAVIEALGAHDGACPALPVADTVRREDGGFAGEEIDRAALRRAQTPQGFRFAAILAAHRAADGDGGGGFTDDVAVARAHGLRVVLTKGDEANFKLTTADDFARAERILGGAMETRTGQGFDVHAFAPGDRVTLCGVSIPHDRALTGHSDADVAMHALTDAIFGALAEGDIGRWFPPSDDRWKGAESRVFLAKAVERLAARGGRLVHADVTIICEAPKIGPHAQAMRESLAAIMGCDAGRVSVKATTTERLGFTGRGEGIAAQAAATIELER